MLSVHKIGGTSMSKFGDVLNNIIVRQADGDNPYNRIFVVSAYSNVTNWLLEHKKVENPEFMTSLRRARIMGQPWTRCWQS